ncbi:NAD(P)-binding domain-containing protein [Catellatospora sp. KI3]|uniref:NAD(P)-dependent oxidoreductase n=1 Tax=Catellatospora sp. KI3 TaxID=3041620 RepID=UPI0024825A35|nr:NAD(P)-binding domain-containing protein [Catellatospora sp. KI3]MDI1462712.1 NAD(P)-binding domain-containing protein [Catellatospora sp. KI3]
MRVAVCGLGRMGTAFAAVLLGAGHEVAVWNRTAGRAGDLVARGAAEAPTAAAAATGADLVVVMVFDASASERALLGPDGVTAGAAPGTLVVNASTVGPDESVGLAARVTAAGLRYLEAPVLGSVASVHAGSLTVLTGGDEADAAEAAPVLAAWSRAGRRHAGPVGAATALKLVANLALGVVAAGMHDAVSLGEDFGLPRELVLDTLALGAFERVAGRGRERLGAQDYTGAPFTLAALAKDLRLATSYARRPLPVASAAATVASAGVAAGDGDCDIAVLGRGTPR